MALTIPPAFANQEVDVVARHARPCEAIDVETSIARASEMFRDFGRSALPVTHQGYYYGTLRESDLLDVIDKNSELSGPIGPFARTSEPVLHPASTVADAWRKFADFEVDTICVVAHDGHVIGTISPSDILSRRTNTLRPKPIGGMATPLGVYLSNGIIKGGANSVALVLTGSLLFLLLFGSDLLATYSLSKAQQLGLSDRFLVPMSGFLPIFIFLIALRIIPLAGTHAAEHMVVHAIERGEELTPEIVRRMPRVHPRCGTNIAAGAGIFLGVFSSNIVADNQLRLLLAALLTLYFWRPVGAFLQYFVTTRKPSDKQIRDGIRAGNELLANYAQNPVFATNPLRRILNSGMLHVIVGSALAAGLLELIGRTFGLSDWLRVYL